MEKIYQEVLLRRQEVLRVTGLSNSTFYNRIKDGVIQPGVPMGPRLKGWPRSEIALYIKNCIDARGEKVVPCRNQLKSTEGVKPENVCNDASVVIPASGEVSDLAAIASSAKKGA